MVPTIGACSPRRRRSVSVDDSDVRRGRALRIVMGLALSLLALVLAAAVTSAGGTGQTDAIAAAAQRLLLYAGVFALIGLAGAGLVATDRFVMSTGIGSSCGPCTGPSR